MSDHAHTHAQGHEEEHHHHVSSMFTLGFVLLILLVLTILTFSLGFVEAWVSETWNWPIPAWLNVLIVMSIATVKAILVLAYFMHLRYDNALNSVIFFSCIFATALFLGLTMLDLGTRDRVYAYKAEIAIPGGNSVGFTTAVSVDRNGETEQLQIPVYTPLYQWVKLPEVAEARLGKKAYEKVSAKHAAYHKGEYGSSAQMSRPATGITPGLFDAEVPTHSDGHHGDGLGGDHDTSGSDGHGGG